MTSFQLGRLAVHVDGQRVAFVGRLDDTAPIGDLPAQLPPGPVIVDAGGITFVNSVGMREWIRFARALRPYGPTVVERVADVLMTQMNLIPELAQTLRVVSFHAQYACGRCGAETAPLVDAVGYGPQLRAMQPPVFACPECGGPMELADFPQRYLTIFTAMP